MSEPFDTPLRETPPNTRCVSCEAPLEPGQRLRCRLCVQAARIAIEEAGGAVVRSSDVARVQERLAANVVNRAYNMSAIYQWQMSDTMSG